MKDNTTNYKFPDFDPDDDTEDMTGISIYCNDDNSAQIKDKCNDLDSLPEIPPELDIYNRGYLWQDEEERKSCGVKSLITQS